MKDLLSAPEASALLGVSPDRVRALAAHGRVPAEKVGNQWIFERAALLRRRDQGVGAGRPFAAHNAWALLLLASGQDVADIDPSVRSRLRRAISRSGLEQLAPRLGRRAVIHSLNAHAGEVRHLLRDPLLVRSGVSAAAEYGLDLVSGSEVDGYVQESELEDLIESHALAPGGAESNVRLRVVPDSAWRFVVGAPVAPIAAVALDLAEDPDPRSASVGRLALKDLPAGPALRGASAGLG